MWTLKLIFVLCFILEVNSEEFQMPISLAYRTNCSIFQTSYKFKETDEVTFIFLGQNLNYGWLKQREGPNGKESTLMEWNPDNLNERNKTSIYIQKNHNGTWKMELLYFKDVNKIGYYYKGHNYTRLLCPFEVTVVELPVPPNERLIYISVISVVIVVAIIIITSETICIICLKKKVRSDNKYDNLTKISMDTLPTNKDLARYCSEPLKKGVEMIEPTVDSRPESEIYEAPDMLAQPLSSGPPPAIPCTPRPDRNALIQQVPSYPTFPRSKPQEEDLANRPPLALPGDRDVRFQPFEHNREMNMAKRPPIPVPTEQNCEVYEEMDPIEEQEYEPPPVANFPPRAQTLQHTSVSKPTKPPTGFPQHRMELPPEGQRFRPSTGNKPQTARKPPGHPRTGSAPANELAQALQRRQTASGGAQPNELAEALRRRQAAAEPLPVFHSKPPVQPAPIQEGGAQPNELAEALKRRQAATAKAAAQNIPESNHRARLPSVNSPPMHSPPVHSQLMHSQSMHSPTKQPTKAKPQPISHNQYKPPPVFQPKPPTQPAPMEEAIYSNQAEEPIYWSDEEWTYEPLKPAQSFTKNHQ